MTTVPYSGAAGQVSYLREVGDGQAMHPNYFKARMGEEELRLSAEHHNRHAQLDAAHFANQQQSEDVWTQRMRAMHQPLHDKINDERATYVPPAPYTHSYSPCRDGPRAPKSYM
eukprot:TRINITY_DN5813_c0_g2_i1.p1 TRINITY_DN5813_c0_g2~~TRINITY_DN5813_c0_g2_i1.p1  ORF type:complete len:114 (+),score=12.97 TRINITY_DN5813_c0_g2_i1:55-396(+)